MKLLTSLILNIVCLTSLSSFGSSIDDLYPSCSPTGITVACQPGGGNFSALPGRYTLNLKIGHKTFKDRLSITYVTRHPGFLNFAEVLAGEFTSPEAKLFSPLIDGKISQSTLPPSQGSSAGFEMAFRIRVKENGSQYSVYFLIKGPSSQFCENSGVAYLDEARTKVMGTLTLTKNSLDCACP